MGPSWRYVNLFARKPVGGRLRQPSTTTSLVVPGVAPLRRDFASRAIYTTIGDSNPQHRFELRRRENPPMELAASGLWAKGRARTISPSHLIGMASKGRWDSG